MWSVYYGKTLSSTSCWTEQNQGEWELSDSPHWRGWTGQNCKSGICSLFHPSNWRMFWLHLLRHWQQDLIPSRVKLLINKAELESGRPVRQITTDGGSEFNNKCLLNWFQNRKIIHDDSTAYTSERNGLDKNLMGVLESAAARNPAGRAQACLKE